LLLIIILISFFVVFSISLSGKWSENPLVPKYVGTHSPSNRKAIKLFPIKQSRGEIDLS
jgi:hypothetical protein